MHTQDFLVDDNNSCQYLWQPCIYIWALSLLAVAAWDLHTTNKALMFICMSSNLVQRRVH